MRTAFKNKLTDLANKNKDVMLLVNDVGFSVFEKFMELFPKQYLNMGISEQSMTGFAAGLAMEGKIPFLYSIIPFVTMRNFEQIRNDICYPNVNVKLIGIGAGFSYGTYGYTHYALEDIALLRTLPNLTIFSPADPQEAESVTEEAFKIKGPVYIRLGKNNEPNLYKKSKKIYKGKATWVKQGTDIAILATGTVLGIALQISETLEKKGISTAVFSFHTIKPLDNLLLEKLSKTMKGIFTIEEHYIQGGFGEMVSAIIAQTKNKVLFKSFGINQPIQNYIGTQSFMRGRNGLSEKKLVQEILKLI